MTDPTPDLCCVHGPKLDRILELLEGRRAHDRPRGYTLGDQFNHLIKRHEQLLISDAQFYKIIAEITGVRYPAHEIARRRAEEFLTPGRELNADEAREAEDMGLRVVECTGVADDEAVFLVEQPEQGRPRFEQGHIINSPRFQAALEKFRQSVEEVKEQES